MHSKIEWPAVVTRKVDTNHNALRPAFFLTEVWRQNHARQEITLPNTQIVSADSAAWRMWHPDMGDISIMVY